MDKIYNFSATAAPLPEAVLGKVREQAFNYNGRGISVLELAPGTKEYTKILTETELALRKILDIPTGYTVLFLEAPAAAQYSAIPLKILRLLSLIKTFICKRRKTSLMIWINSTSLSNELLPTTSASHWKNSR